MLLVVAARRRAASPSGRPTGPTGHGRRRRPPSRRPGAARRRLRPLAAARRRGRAARRFDRHAVQPAGRAVEEPRADRDRLATDGPPLISVEASPDGKVVGVGEAYGGLSFYDTSTRELLGSYDEMPVWKFEFRPDGEQLAISAQPIASEPERRSPSHPCGSSMPPRSRTSRSSSAASPRARTCRRRTTAPTVGSWRGLRGRRRRRRQRPSPCGTWRHRNDPCCSSTLPGSATRSS